MKKTRVLLDFEIGKLTNSIENTLTGESFSTQLIRLGSSDLRVVTKKNGWQFNWRQELKARDREVYKLIVLSNTSVIHGLVSLTFRTDHVILNLVENAPFNKGKSKVYDGVAGNLVAFACSLSFQRGHEGNVVFTAKTKLIDHYMNSLGAMHVGGHKMIINTEAAAKLVEKYLNLKVMKRKKDPLDEIDLYVDPRPMTKEDEEMISKYIQERKRKNLLKGKKQKGKRAA